MLTPIQAHHEEVDLSFLDSFPYARQRSHYANGKSLPGEEEIIDACDDDEGQPRGSRHKQKASECHE